MANPRIRNLSGCEAVNAWNFYIEKDIWIRQ